MIPISAVPAIVAYAALLCAPTIAESAVQCNTVSNISNTPVRRSLSPSLGSVSAGGLYMAPPTMTSIQVVTVTAVSVADTSKTAKATIVVNASSSTTPVNLFGAYGRSGIVTDGTKIQFRWSGRRRSRLLRKSAGSRNKLSRLLVRSLRAPNALNVRDHASKQSQCSDSCYYPDADALSVTVRGETMLLVDGQTRLTILSNSAFAVKRLFS
jgi:hypothetical protein